MSQFFSSLRAQRNNPTLRMWLWIAASLTLLTMTSVAQADIYLRKDTAPPMAKPMPQIETPPANTSTNSDRATLVRFANEFHSNCASRDNPVLAGQELEMLCACTAANIPDGMSAQDISVFQDNSPAGQQARQRMMLNVYAPCLQYPARAITNYNCMNTPELQGRVNNVPALCGCVADGIGQYIAANGPAVMRQSLARDPNTLDPLQALVNSNEFNQRSQSILMSCITKGF